MEEDNLNAYFDDIAGAIEMLKTIEEIQCESEYRDALRDRIAYLKQQKTAGDAWVDNDNTASPDAWKTLATYTDAEARKQYAVWEA